MVLPSREAGELLWRVLDENTDQKLPLRRNRWHQWIWNQEIEPYPHYPFFKAQLYGPIDPTLGQFFYTGMKHTIRLDEILWGGVRTDGIPPLEHPTHIHAGEARYLGKDNIVFGVFLNGEARAYPKRILAWHELFNDTIGGIDVTCAYCTLCGAAVLYRQQLGAREVRFWNQWFSLSLQQVDVRSPDQNPLVRPGGKSRLPVNWPGRTYGWSAFPLSQPPGQAGRSGIPRQRSCRWPRVMTEMMERALLTVSISEPTS